MTPRQRDSRAGGVAVALLLAVVAVTPVEAQEAPFEALPLAPDPGEQVALTDMGVAISFFDPTGRLDPESVQLFLNDRNITGEASITPELLIWRPAVAESPGLKRVLFTARDRLGEPLPPLSWTFTLSGEVEDRPEGVRASLPRWAPAQGNVTFQGTTTSVSGPGADFRRDEATLPLLWVNLSGTFAPGWRYSTRIHTSGYESADRQPVNRYRFDVRSRNLNVTVGDANPVFQSLILEGRRVRGVEMDLRSRFGNLQVVRGDTRRAIDGRLTPGDPSQIELGGTFRRELVAVRPSFGGGETFQAGMTFLRVRDQTNSIGELRTSPAQEGGSTRSVNPLPKDNFVAGADLSWRTLEGRLHLRYENAFSLYANDISGGPLTRFQLDSILESQGYDPLGIDPERWERFFILNASAIPLDPGGMTSLAQQLRGTFRVGSHVVSAEWRSVGGSYYSLGNSALQRDRKGIRIRDSFLALENTLAVSAGFERDEDNLDDLKPATTTSTGFFADANWQRTPRSVGVNGSVRFGTRSNGLGAGDPEARDEVNRTLSVGVSLPVDLREGYTTRLALNTALVTREDDLNPVAGSRNLFLLGGIQGETDDRNTEFGLMYGISRTELTGFEGAETTFHRVVGNLRRRIAPRWMGVAEGNLTRADSPGGAEAFGPDYGRRELLAGAEWEWLPGSSVSFRTGVISYSDNRFPDRDTREIQARIRVARAF